MSLRPRPIVATATTAADWNRSGRPPPAGTEVQTQTQTQTQAHIPEQAQPAAPALAPAPAPAPAPAFAPAAAARPARAAAPEAVSLADITEHLLVWFDGAFHATAIARVVRQCHRELEIAHGPVPAAALEYLARERLDHLARQARP